MTIEEKCHEKVADILQSRLDSPDYDRLYAGLYKTLLPVMKFEEFEYDEEFEE